MSKKKITRPIIGNQLFSKSFTIESWMINEYGLIGLDLNVFAIVYNFEPISIDLICDLFEKYNTKVKLAAQNLIENYLLIVQDDYKTLEVSKKVKDETKNWDKRVAAKHKKETLKLINGTPAIMCANEVDGTWWYEATNPLYSLILERGEQENESEETTPLDEYKKNAFPYERREILATCNIENETDSKIITKKLKEMQKQSEDAEKYVLFMLGKANQYDPFGNGRWIALRKKKEMLAEKASEIFQIIWKEYPRKTAKAQAEKTFLKKMANCKSEFEIKKKARKIYWEMKQAIMAWQNEKDGEGRPTEYIPYFSSWLNDTI